MSTDGKATYSVTSREIAVLVTFGGQVRAHYARLGAYNNGMCHLDRGKKELILDGVDPTVVDAIVKKKPRYL